MPKPTSPKWQAETIKINCLCKPLQGIASKWSNEVGNGKREADSVSEPRNLSGGRAADGRRAAAADYPRRRRAANSRKRVVDGGGRPACSGQSAAGGRQPACSGKCERQAVDSVQREVRAASGGQPAGRGRGAGDGGQRAAGGRWLVAGSGGQARAEASGQPAGNGGRQVGSGAASDHGGGAKCVKAAAASDERQVAGASSARGKRALCKGSGRRNGQRVAGSGSGRCCSTWMCAVRGDGWRRAAEVRKPESEGSGQRECGRQACVAGSTMRAQAVHSGRGTPSRRRRAVGLVRCVHGRRAAALAGRARGRRVAGTGSGRWAAAGCRRSSYAKRLAALDTRSEAAMRQETGGLKKVRGGLEKCEADRCAYKSEETKHLSARAATSLDPCPLSFQCTLNGAAGEPSNHEKEAQRASAEKIETQMYTRSRRLQCGIREMQSGRGDCKRIRWKHKRRVRRQGPRSFGWGGFHVNVERAHMAGGGRSERAALA
ncbi:hypothetical protein GGX14DRAFT_404758 [Mycena pura]|uniref:Uncharacterized protein n=1 Tax=Mycena pura TaxID=153505 RepID=A0AAD6UTJ0_9AGAR|nr:hypothetical protein GGX14DRAFT_404758 [Mycena pura]